MKIPVPESLSDKVAGLRSKACNFIKKRDTGTSVFL